MPFRAQTGRPVAAVPALVDRKISRVVCADAFSNPDHLKFAIRGSWPLCWRTLSTRQSLGPGLSTAVATCIITALSTIGVVAAKAVSSTWGAIIGGIIFGMGAQSLRSAASGLDHRIHGFVRRRHRDFGLDRDGNAAGSPILGVQLALAFYLINLQEFAITVLRLPSLATASSAYCLGWFACGWSSIACG